MNIDKAMLEYLKKIILKKKKMQDENYISVEELIAVYRECYKKRNDYFNALKNDWRMEFNGLKKVLPKLIANKLYIFLIFHDEKGIENSSFITCDKTIESISFNIATKENWHLSEEEFLQKYGEQIVKIYHDIMDFNFILGDISIRTINDDVYFSKYGEEARVIFDNPLLEASHNTYSIAYLFDKDAFMQFTTMKRCRFFLDRKQIMDNSICNYRTLVSFDDKAFKKILSNIFISKDNLLEKLEENSKILIK